MNKINVVCAACIKNGKVLIAQRNYGSSKGFYEFPGGKVEKNETKEEAIKREWKEECDVEIENIQFLANNTDIQDNTWIDLTCFVCTTKQEPKLSVHANFVWTTPDKIFEYNFFTADKVLVDALERKWECLIRQMK